MITSVLKTNRLLYNYATLVLLFLFTTTAVAQQFTATVNQTNLAVGEKFQLSFTLNASGGNFEPPSFENFDVYGPPSQSVSQSNINGKVSQSVSLSYILAAKKEGKFTINPAKVLVNGKTLQSNAITITVSKNGGSEKQWCK